MKSIGNSNPASPKNLVLPFAISLILFNALITIYSAHWLRPAADDYCFAWITGERGIVESVVNAWNTINGYAFSNLNASIWVGWPLAYLPMSLASLIPFMLAAIGISLVVLSFSATLFQGRFLSRLIAMVCVVFFWWIFLWAPEALNGFVFTPNTFSVGETIAFAHGLTHWQINNGQYVMQLVLLLLGACALQHYFSDKSSLRLLLLACLGILAGMAGPTLASSIIVFFGMNYLYALVKKQNVLIFSKSETLGLLMACLAGLFISQLLSPGNQIRMQLLGTSFHFSPAELLGLLNTSYTFSVQLWFNSYFSIGSALVFLLVCGISSLYFPKDEINKASYFFKIAFYFSIFALLQIFINRCAEFFAYRAYWHFISAITCIYISILFFGISAGLRLAIVSTEKNWSLVINTVIIICVLMATSVNIFLIQSIYARQALWSGAPAPTPHVRDIEENWVKGCWYHLNAIRPNSLQR
jgi:hypothetical protein